ncbi:hypothetical protein [Pseudomonas cannabina]|uniref:hypothetical protein n=1 Tax=Pseudomonas cannabina TaxID=86840 RepID=UPI000EFF0EA1|nr:hypothetical protein [Pseudomonas cannabina]
MISFLKFRESFSATAERFGLKLRLPPGVTWATKLRSILFSSKRSDYYLYIADIIKSTKGQLNFKQIFINDAARYKGKSRGHLSAHWYQQFNSSGGNLKQTFSGTLPQEDVELLDALQRLGGLNALEGGFSDLAHNSGVVNKARTQLIATTFAAFAAMMVVVALVLIIPPFTVPTIRNSFSMIPDEDLPASARRLFGFSDFIDAYWFLIFSTAVGIMGLCYWSFSNMTGKMRIFFDKYGFAWSMYRDFQSLRFITSLGSMTKPRGNVTMGLLDAIKLQLRGASRWKRYHVNQMVAMVQGGNASSDIFATGMVDVETYFYLDDLTRSRGFDDALQYVRTRIESRVLKRIQVQSQILSWVLMMTAISVSSYIMLWHYQVIEDLRMSMQMLLN